MATTARDIVEQALLRLTVLAAGEAMAAEDASNGLRSLNNLIDEWGTEKLTIHSETRSTFTITETASFTVGSGGDCSIVWPRYIEHIRYQDTATDPDEEFPLSILTDDAWAGITQKALTAARPDRAYYNPTYPLGTLYLWPIPTDSNLEGVIYAKTAIVELTTLDTAISLPPGYRSFMITALAWELQGEYGKPPDPVLKMIADRAKANVKRSNIRLMDLSVDRGALVQSYGSGNYDIYQGP